jgi:hypothetical protein
MTRTRVKKFDTQTCGSETLSCEIHTLKKWRAIEFCLEFSLGVSSEVLELEFEDLDVV